MTVSSVFQDYMQEGTHASRPSAPAVGTNGIALYYETDTAKTFLWDSGGAAWVQVSSGSLASISDGQLLANISGGSAAPVGNTLSAYLDHVLSGAANGDIIIRSGGVWTRLAKGSDTQVLTLASGLPTWATPAAGGGGLFSSIMSAAKTANTGLNTNVNVTTATINDGTQGQRIIAPSLGATSLEGVSKAIGGKTTWTVLLSLNLNLSAGTGQGGAGIGFQSTAGKFETVMFYGITNAWHIYASHWASATSYTNTDTDILYGTGAFAWLQIHDDGTHMNYNYSYDGENWTLVRQVTKAGNPNMADYLNFVYFALPQNALTTELLSYSDS